MKVLRLENTDLDKFLFDRMRVLSDYNWKSFFCVRNSSDLLFPYLF